jgi:large subunit ribosomal protein L22
MQARAQAKFIRMAPRKVRLLVSLIRGMHVRDARLQLEFSTKDAAVPVLKALNSAVANAEHNLKADTSNFHVLTAYVDEGPKFMRFTPRAQGRATPIRKRMSHITIVVGDKHEEVVEAKSEVKEVKAEKKATKSTPKKKTVKA